MEQSVREQYILQQYWQDTHKKGLPAFGIYGHDVQDLDDNSIPEDVAEKILRFARAAQAVATMRGKSYLSMGSVSMGIAGSIVNPDFFQEYLGMRNESVDLTEIIRRMEEGIYDHEEYEKAMAWTEKHCKVNEGDDFKNRPEKRKNREEKDKRLGIYREDDDYHARPDDR